jgi:hypothetical protein
MQIILKDIFESGRAIKEFLSLILNKMKMALGLQSLFWIRRPAVEQCLPPMTRNGPQRPHGFATKS